MQAHGSFAIHSAGQTQSQAKKIYIIINYFRNKTSYYLKFLIVRALDNFSFFICQSEFDKSLISGSNAIYNIVYTLEKQYINN